MTQRHCRIGASIAATLGLAMLVPAAFAQTPPAAPPQQTQGNAPAGQPDAGPTPNDTELKHFAMAAVDVQNIRQSMQPRLAGASSAAARTQIKATAEKQMESAVRNNDLSLNRYVQIADVVQSDPAIRAKVQSFMPPAPPAS